MKLIQGLAKNLHAKGFGVVLHITDAEGVRKQVLELAKKRYYAQRRARGMPRRRFDVSAVVDVLGEVAENVDYLVGWTLIPVNMMNGGMQRFMPVDAFDGAAARGSGAGT